MALCVLNLSSPNRKLQPDPASFAGERAHIYDANEIPPDDTLILYVVGHAIPDALIGPDGETLSEQSVALAIQAKRAGKQTLIIWDVCYAESFRQIANIEPWDNNNNYVHIFSCQAFERTWLQPPDPAGDPTPTVFSKELHDAIVALGPAWEWCELEERLRARFGALQKPQISPQNRLTRSVFFSSP